MNVSRQTLDSLAAQTGFRPGTLEKVVRLGQLAADISRQPVLSRVLALKGGTALNLGFGPPSRLSVDLDLNYVGSADREAMLRDRPIVERLIEQIGRGQGYRLQWSADEHAGRKVYLRFQSPLGGADDVQIDLNFLFRVPLGEPGVRELWQPGDLARPSLRMAAFVEIAAGKLVATLARGLPRDLYDTARLPRLDADNWAHPSLRRTFVALAGVLDRPLTAYNEDRMRVTDEQVRQQLDPMLARHTRISAADLNAGAWQVLSPLLDLTAAEREYTERLQRGELQPDLLFPDDSEMAKRLSHHPALLWKMANAREHVAKRLERFPPAPRGDFDR